MRMITVRPIWHNCELRDDLTPLWASSCVGAECAGANAGAGAGNTEFLDLFAIFGEKLDEFLLDIGVVWPTFFEVRSDWYFFFFSACFRKTCFSMTSILCGDVIVGLGICSSAMLDFGETGVVITIVIW